MDTKSPVKAGWRGNVTGAIENTDSRIEVSEITLKLDGVTAYALCNHLTDDAIKRAAPIGAASTAKESPHE